MAGREILSARHPDTLTTINSMALLLEARGELDEVETPYREALEELSEVLGAGHPDKLAAITNLASLQQAQGELVEAEQLYRGSSL